MTTPCGVATKLCRKCNIVKPYSEYYKQSDSSTGIMSQCKDCSNKRVKKWVGENSGKRVQICKRYYEKNKETWWRFVHTRRERIGESGVVSKDLPERLLALQKYKCACCKKDLRKVGYELDHIEALANGGSNDDLNIQLLCRKCNRAKSTKHFIDFMQAKGYLL